MYGGFDTTTSEALVVRHAAEPVAVRERHALGERARGGVRARHVERVLARVHGGHDGVRRLLRDRERDGAGAGAEVEHARAFPARTLGGEHLEHGLDEFLPSRAAARARGGPPRGRGRGTPRGP